MHCMLMDLLHGFEVLSTTEETLFNSRNVSRLVQNNCRTYIVQSMIHIVFFLVFLSGLSHAVVVLGMCKLCNRTGPP